MTKHSQLNAKKRILKNHNSALQHLPFKRPQGEIKLVDPKRMHNKYVEDIKPLVMESSNLGSKRHSLGDR